MVRGTITYGDNSETQHTDYEHGWVEFEYNGNWWVYDDHYRYPIPRKLWYKISSPYYVKSKFTQEDLLNYMMDKHKEQISVQETEEGINISTEDIYDEKYHIPFMYLDMKIKDGVISQLTIDKNDKFRQIHHVREVVDWC